MPTKVERSSLLDTAHFGYLLYAFVYSVVATNVEKIVAYSAWLITNTKLEHDISMFESRVCERFAI